MDRLNCLLCAAIVLALLILPVNPLHAADTSGKVALGLHGGVYKLGLTDHSDAWTVGWLVNGELKYGITPTFSLGVEGNWMQNKLADLTVDTRGEDGAQLTFDSVEDGPGQKAYLAGLLGVFHFLPDKSVSPFFSLGAGMYFWQWVDKDGSTLMSDDPSLEPVHIPTTDLADNPYELKDQELYAMAGLGVEFYPTESISLELGAKGRWLTHVFTSFTDDQDIVGSDPGQLDLPKAIAEVYGGLTFYFGGEKCPVMTSTASASAASGTIPLAVQFNGVTDGGCPPVTHSWSFGDGGTSADQNPSHTYETAGDYLASLTVTDAKGTTSQGSVAISATVPPVVGTASVSPKSGPVPLTVQFDANGNGGIPPLAYSWDFGDGRTSGDQNPSHAYDKPGNYTAALTVTDSKGTASRKELSIAATEKFVPTVEKPVILEGVNFLVNKAELFENAKKILDVVATSLIAHPEVNVEIGGHTDADGSDAYNLKLSDRRAKAVQDYLVKKGVPAAQLTAKGYGETQPVADNATPEGKAKNRRVELKRM